MKFKLKIKGDDNEDDEDLDEDEDEGNGAKMGGATSEEVEALQGQIKRLTDALMKLKDLSVYEKKESEKVIKQLQRDKEVIPVLEDKIKTLKEDGKKADDQINHLKEELDIALEAEDMIQELTEKNLSLEEVRIFFFLLCFFVSFFLMHFFLLCFFSFVLFLFFPSPLRASLFESMTHSLLLYAEYSRAATNNRGSRSPSTS